MAGQREGRPKEAIVQLDSGAARDGKMTNGGLRIAFISAPGQGTIEPSSTAQLPFRFPSLTIPHLTGFLAEQGYQNVRHYEMDLFFDRFVRMNRGVIDLAQLTDADFAAHAAGEVNPVTRLASRLLDFAQLEAADLFGLSLGLADMDDPSSMLQQGALLCLIPGLKRRYPHCRIAVGGLVTRSLTRARGWAAAMLSRYRDIDWMVLGPGEEPLRRILDSMQGGAALPSAGESGHEVGDRVLTAEPDRDHGHVSLPVVLPVFQTAEERRVTGTYLGEVYPFTDEMRAELSAHAALEVLPLTYRFVDGCSAGCAYCIHSRRQVRALAVKEVVRAIGSLAETHDTRSFVFMNSCLNWSYEYAMEFATELKEAKLGLYWTDSIGFAHLDERLIAALSEAGLCRADLGVESGSDRLLNLYRKPTTRARMSERLEWLHRHGVWNFTNLISGLPSETEEDLEETFSFLEACREFIDGYDVTPFWLSESSLVYREPMRFGIQLQGPAVLSREGFRIPFLAGGRTFEASNRVAIDRRTAIIRKMDSLKAIPGRGLGGGHRHNTEPYTLILWLYRALGHGNKRDIARIYSALLHAGDPLESKAEDREPTGQTSPAPPSELASELAALQAELRVGDALPGQFRLVGTRPGGDGALKITLDSETGRVVLGARRSDDGKPALCRGQVISLFVYAESAHVPESYVQAYCRLLNGLVLRDTPQR